ncbi:DUF742 domain-containing protein [Dactylosporangium sp. AC04546]|uniref:DUF742 domain-containing protein n=1 Tax=Dactylosporangium sp. AC04546 TaxID=2862460 RepID=UPI0027E206AB|nr:DUF742 domain-containing protein [Dactylosporangium sp. AC04546]WVK88880.1 DUF742 domain-containing protein [Dactylosporangium sp. AC04546]
MTAEPPRGIRPYLHAPVAPVSPAHPAQPSGDLRPYVLTSGRVQHADPSISLETQVTARPGAPPEAVRIMPTEMQAILAACALPASVAEISARVRLHLGVTKILVTDLCAAGYLDIHRLDASPVNNPDVILRVIHGLRAIS